MDPEFEPAAMETRTLFGLQMEQLRNNAKIDSQLFTNVVSKKKEVSVPSGLPSASLVRILFILPKLLA